VLLVDDDPGLLQALSETLELRMRSLEVDTSDSARAALERVSAIEYDAIVADIKMPGMDGMQLLARIHELRPETPTLLITGHGEHDLAVQALRGGAHDYVQKPIDREYFIGSLSHAIERRQLSRKVAEQRQKLEEQSKDLEECLEDRTRELRELYRREALARAELAKTTVELEAAHRRQTELIAVIAHELATPLTTLRGYAELVSRPTVGAAVRDRAKEILVSETKRMERLVQDLVDGADRAPADISIQLDDCDIAALLRDQVDAAGAHSKRHAFVLNAPERLEARCDRGRVAQVVANLLNNAVKHTPGGEVRVALRRDGQNARLSVCDQGPGIPADSLDAIFEPRVRLVPARPRTRRAPNGAGLGLSIARRIVEAHGGRIWAESTPGEGACFNLVLPIAARAPVRGDRRRMRVVKKLVAESPTRGKTRARRGSRQLGS
jgi:signal transduction histidine kinase